MLAPERLRTPQPHLRHKRGWLLHEPLGVVAVISPWNFPFGIPFTEAVTAVAAGNAVLLKPSELTPLSGAWVATVFERAGAPPGLVRVLQGGGETGAALVSAPGIAKVFFTGSAAVGRKVAAEAGSQLRAVQLELGGKDPMLVFDDADLDRAVDGALWGGFSNCGQVCSGVERIYVARPLYEPFVEELSRRAAALRIGSGGEPFGRARPARVRGRAHEGRVARLGRARARRRGAHGRAPRGAGPAGLVLPADGADGRVAAGSTARRSSARSSPSRRSARRTRRCGSRTTRRSGSARASGRATSTARAALALRLEAGSVWTNDVAYSYGAGQATWGGVKESGHGRTHGRYGLEACTQVKFVDLDSGRLPVPWWYPYGPQAVDGFQGMVGVLYGQGLGAKASAAWRHRRGLVHLGKRYLRR